MWIRRGPRGVAAALTLTTAAALAASPKTHIGAWVAPEGGSIRQDVDDYA